VPPSVKPLTSRSGPPRRGECAPRRAATRRPGVVLAIEAAINQDGVMTAKT